MELRRVSRSSWSSMEAFDSLPSRESRYSPRSIPGIMRQERDDLVQERGQEAADDVVGHGLRGGAVPQEEAVVPESAVVGVQQAGLHEFEGLDVVDEVHADLVEGRPSVAEGVLDDPLCEGFGEHGPGVVEAEPVHDGVPLPGGRGRGDAVHHARGERTLAVDPVGQVGVP